MRRHDATTPDRRWTATIWYRQPHPVTAITGTVYGPNPTEAERRYLAWYPAVERIVIHTEQTTR